MRVRSGPSLAERAVLALLCEGPTHGYAVSELLAAEGPLGQIWTVKQALVYRAIDTLLEQGLIERVGEGPGRGARRRIEYAATAQGRAANRAWLDEPVKSVRDIRADFLLKLALLKRAGAETEPLLRRQVEALAETVERLRAEAAGELPEVRLWRQTNSEAALRFVERLLAQEREGAGVGVEA